MPGITVSTGYSTSNNRHPTGRKESEKVKVVVLANLGGDKAAQAGISKPIRLDKDNFDAVFKRMGVNFTLPGTGEQIRFNEIEQFAPDYLYEELPLFSKYRHIVRKLKSKNLFQEAVEQLEKEGWMGVESPSGQDDSPSVGESAESSVSLLEGLIDRSQEVNKGGFSVEALIKETISPYLEAKADPNVATYVRCVENAAADVLRAILHSKEFRAIEGNWRSLDLLNRRLDTDSECELWVCDCPLTDLVRDAESEVGDGVSAVYSSLIEPASVLGEKPYDVVVVGDCLAGDKGDQLVLQHMANEFSRERNSTHIVAGIDLVAMLGADDLSKAMENGLAEIPDIPFFSGVNQLELNASLLHLCAPRYMYRYPYGDRTKPVESMAFEELDSENGSGLELYSWASSAYLQVIALVGQRLDTREASLIEGLPLHVFSDEFGEETVVPTTEAYLPESVVNRLKQVRVTSIQSVKNSDSVRVPSLLT